MPHITFALEGFFPDNIGGTEHYVLNLAKELRERGNAISIIKPSKEKQNYQYQFDGFDVYCFPITENPSAEELNGIKLPDGIEYFKEILIKLKPDIFHLHSLGRALNTNHLKIAHEVGIKTVFTSHLGSNFCLRGNLKLFGKTECNGQIKQHRCLACFIHQQKNTSQLTSNLFAFLINKLIISNSMVKKFPAFRIVDYKLDQVGQLKKYSNIIISLADWFTQIYLVNGLQNPKTIKQGIDKIFIQARIAKVDVKEKIQLIFIGRLHPLKNLDLLLNVVSGFHSFFDLTILTIPFEKEINYYNQIKNQYHQLGYTNWFENLSSEQVIEKLDQADILVLPSKYEVAPLVILEAFARKTTIIGSDFIAIKEMVEHNVDGLIFKNGDSSELKALFQRLIDETGLFQYLKNNIKPVRTFKEVAAEHEELYRNL